MSSREDYPQQRTIRGKESPTPFHSQHIAHRGACGKTQVVPQNRRPRPEPAEMGVATCVCFCRRPGRAGTSNRWSDSRCGCGHSVRRCGCARRRRRRTCPGAVELVAAQFVKVAAAAEGCDALVAAAIPRARRSSSPGSGSSRNAAPGARNADPSSTPASTSPPTSTSITAVPTPRSATAPTRSCSDVAATPGTEGETPT